MKKRTISSFRGDHAFLSNFHPSPVFLDGCLYPTVEHAFQAAKSINAIEREQIRRAPSPGQAKRIGREVELRDGWDEMKVGVMNDLLRQKFQIPHLRKALKRTGAAWLIEGNTWGDTFWGISNGVGSNHLGRLLMRIRDELRA